jgi:DNA repair exonuclease SbcCD ATPase subunit
MAMVDIEKSLARMLEKIQKDEGRRALLKEQLAKAEVDLIQNTTRQENIQKARSMVIIVAERMQRKLEFHISALVSMALAAVFPDPYKFELRFIPRRGKTEADLVFIKNGNETTDLPNSGGGGVCDIASLALRIAVWNIKKTRACLILDEPTKYLHSPTYQAKASELIKELSEKIGLQIIMATDQDRLIEMADTEIHFANINGVATIADKECVDG